MRNVILQGDALSVLRQLPSNYVQMCVTSPPYYSQRDYGVDGQIGLEETPEEFVDKLVTVFREVRRVLRTDGTLWVNLGDTYANDGKWGGTTGGKHVQELHGDNATRRRWYTGLKPKDLIMIPARVALALQTDGWWLRQEICWSKNNAMPESVQDRCTRSHEMVYMLAKSERYFYDAESIKEPSEASEESQQRARYQGYDAGHAKHRGKEEGNGKIDFLSAHKERYWPSMRNKRSVWQVNTSPFSGAHFATFPEKLVSPMILAGSSPQACEHCGAPWERVTERIQFGKAPSDTRYTDEKMQATRLSGSCQAYRAMGLEGPPAPKTVGWQPTCKCKNDGKGKCIVMDIFAGSGTVPMVALQHGRDYLGIELNSSYIEMAERRISTTQQNLWTTEGVI